MSAASDYLENVIINWIRGTPTTPPSTLYLRLFTLTTDDAAGGTEVTGGAYAPQTITLSAPSPAGVTSNSNLITFPVATADWGTVTHCAVYDASSGGNRLLHGPMLSPRLINTGDQMTIQIGRLTLTAA